MKKIKSFFLILTIAIIALQCKDEEEPQQTVSPYESCCGTEPVEYTIGAAKVFVPNVFTVNNDGINDVFFPFFNSNVSKIESFSISLPDLSLIYYVSTVNLQNPSLDGWDGLDTDGELYAGLFNYAMAITNDSGFVQTISGSACSIVCDTFSTVFKTKTGCYFPVQENGDGGFDASLPTLEGDCFGQ